MLPLRILKGLPSFKNMSFHTQNLRVGWDEEEDTRSWSSVLPGEDCAAADDAERRSTSTSNTQASARDRA
jgi:hypothetical protein